MARDATPPVRQEIERVAPGRPQCAARYADLALLLFESGYEPIPIRPGKKAPAPARWSTIPIDTTTVETWCAQYPGHGIGLRTGHLVGIDIDLLDPDLAHRIQDLAERRLGPAPMRVGLWPKRLLLYRTATPRSKLSLGKLEILGRGQQFVAYGIHPGTGRPYDWPLGDTPAEVPFEELPEVTPEDLDSFLAEAAGLLPASTPPRTRARAGQSTPAATDNPVRDEAGLVIDGRDKWLAIIAFHVVHDRLAAGEPLTPQAMATTTWDRFCATTRLDRARQDGDRTYRWQEALRKVSDKLRLHADGRLPARTEASPPPDYKLPVLGIEDARAALDAHLEDACRQILRWHEERGEAPQIGIRATVGLGKTTMSRRHLLEMHADLQTRGLPDRILVLTPSHALAEETAALWRQDGVTAAVLRGYHKVDPASGEPLCRDIDAVDAAIRCGATIQDSVCISGERRCRHLETCLKQKNRQEVGGADVIVAPYDVLFTGIAMPTDRLALVLIDEGFWARALSRKSLGSIEDFAYLGVEDLPLRHKVRALGDVMDLAAFRDRAGRALHTNGPSIVRVETLSDAGLSAEDCRLAARLEDRVTAPPRLVPGMDATARQNAITASHAAARARDRQRLWRCLAEMLECATTTGRVRLLSSRRAADELEIEVLGRHPIHPNLAGLPVLNLDATLRPDLARLFLPRLSLTSIDAVAPHMSVHQVIGRFGKAALTSRPDGAASRTLRDCIDYVRWQARRVAPGRVLVVTYKGCEADFEGIPGVEVAHFNAIAGLDGYKDVALLITIGRPLPSETDVAGLVSAAYGEAIKTGYGFERRSVHMSDGTCGSLRCQVHGTANGELIRSAICDDEVLQAVGRGRGINRTADNPLEVHLLADVALPLAYDSIRMWETVMPDLLQRMLLRGIAVDSPGDAAALHPGLFGTADQAKKQFEREGFKGQTPYKGSYKGMSLKYARYRRAGRGRSWQQAWWLDGDAEAVLQTLTRALGAVDGWEPL